MLLQLGNGPLPNLEHPEELTVITEVNENDDDDDLVDDEADSSTVWVE